MRTDLVRRLWQRSSWVDALIAGRNDVICSDVGVDDTEQQNGVNAFTPGGGGNLGDGDLVQAGPGR